MTPMIPMIPIIPIDRPLSNPKANITFGVVNHSVTGNCTGPQHPLLGALVAGSARDRAGDGEIVH